MLGRRICTVALLTAVLFGGPRSAWGQTQVTFDHRSVAAISSYTIDVEDGRLFSVEIANTCETEFLYEVLGVGADQPPHQFPTDYRRGANVQGLERSLQPRLGLVSIPVLHDDSYGGYIIEIRRPDTEERPSIVCVENHQTVDLQPVRLAISTPRMGWRASVSAGFSLSGLVNAACDGDGEARRDASCSDARPGLVSFVHAYHTRLDYLAPVFGLGLSEGRPEYYIGGGLRLGNAATFNGGLVVGPVATDFGKDAPTKFKSTWFFGVSYSLIGSDAGTIRAPFAGLGQ